MKSLAELAKIREESLELVNLRVDRKETRAVVGMATCGIAAGARPVLKAMVKEVSEKNLDVEVRQMGCIGSCDLEPIVEIHSKGKDKVTYVNMTEEKIKKVITEHIINGNIVSEYTI